MQWTIRLYKRKKNPDLNGRLKRVGARMIPEDTIPVKLTDLRIRATSKDGARAEAQVQLKKRGFEVASMNFSADTPGTIIAHVFEGKKGMRKAAT